MNASSNIIFNYIGIFVNLYIWEKSRSIFDVTWFNLILFITWSLAFALGSRLLTRFTTRVLIRMTAACGALTFLLLTTLTLDNRLLWIAIIAVPVGIMWGFYASSQNITLSVFGKGKDFEVYFSIATIIGQAISILNPVVFALIIKWIGYSGSFLLMFVFVAVLMTVSFMIPPITLSTEKKPLFQNMRFSEVFSYPAIRWMVPSCLAAGVFLQFQGLFALIFTFSVSSDKLVIALLNVLYAVSAIIAMVLHRRLNIQGGIWLKVGMVAISAGFLVALLQHSVFLVISNILTTVGLFYFGTVWNSDQFRIISRHTSIEQARILLWRECFLNISRIFILILILNVQELKGPVFVTLLAFALGCALLIPLFSQKSADALRRQNLHIES
ncbi:MFS transporter [Paenibacillus piri]|uniref:MFS transporter n=1 Tax=Paenibacillus piri TaxID=2547395 RepID=A0A4R5KU24_9BACL|nr:MFS transporter [Paenibacillus piri]TDF98588.1 MFS transporter [Paenibacillus piri]